MEKDEHYYAIFIVGARVRGRPVRIDPPGPDRWEVTDFLRTLPLEQAEVIREEAIREDEEGDDDTFDLDGGLPEDETSEEDLEVEEGQDPSRILRTDPSAPSWIQEWTWDFDIVVAAGEALLSPFSAKPVASDLCPECGLEVQWFETWMVRDDLWTFATTARGISPDRVMHLTCFERRIGRDLEIRDFTESPHNDLIRFGWRLASGQSRR